MKQYLQIKKIALAVAFSFTSLVGFAQAPAIQWDKTFGTTLNDDLYCLIHTSDGGYLFGGDSYAGISGDKTQVNKGGVDYWIIKVNAAGIKQWDKTFGGSHDDALRAISQTADGGYILGGYSRSNVSGDKSEPSKGSLDYWIIKLDATGTKTWDKTIGGIDDDILIKINQTADGGYILGGHSKSNIGNDKTESNRGSEDYWIVKLDAIGNKVWDKTFGGPTWDYLTDLKQTSDGGYILGGYSHSVLGGDKSQGSQGKIDYWIVKTDGAGNKIWDKTYGTIEDDVFSTLQQTIDGGYILSGYSNGGVNGDKSQLSNGFQDFWLIKLFSNGNKDWDKSIGGNSVEAFPTIKQTADGGYIVGGISGSLVSGDKSENSKGLIDFWLIKLNNLGTRVWDKTVGGNDMVEGPILHQTSDGGYILAGHTLSGISNDKTVPNKGGKDYWIVKLGPDATTGINEPTSTFNLSISPNPSQGKFQLQLNNLTAKTAAITVSDLVGRTVYQQEIPVTGKQINQEIKLPKIKGMYKLQVKTGAQTSTRKIVIE